MKKIELSRLRIGAHSTLDSHRQESIQALASLGHGDAVRTLVEIFKESLWRQNRVYVIRALGQFPSQRAIEFLIDVACDPTDLGLCQEAIKSLGNTRSAVAGRFLMQGFLHGPEVLKPLYALSIGSCKVMSFGGTLLEHAGKAWEDHNVLLLKHCLVAFGEMKFSPSVPLVLKILQAIQGESGPYAKRSMAHGELARTGLSTLGQILRDEGPLRSLESLFSEDPLDRALYQNTLKQVGFRSQWSVEDYLIKLFESPHIHPSLPLEINGFPLGDVLECLQVLFTKTTTSANAPNLIWQRFCRLLQVTLWPDGLLSVIKALPAFWQALENLELLGACVHALGWHESPGVRAFICDLEPFAQKTVGSYAEWVQAKALAFPLAQTLGAPTLADELRALTPDHAMATLQAYSGVGQWVRPHGDSVKSFGSTLDTLTKTPLPKDLLARVIRMAAQCRYPLRVPPAVVERAHSDENLCKSILLLAERCPSRPLAQLAWDLAKGNHAYRLAMVRALASNPHLPPQAEKSLDALLSQMLTGGSEDETLVALHSIYGRPRKALVGLVVEKLKSQESPVVRVAAAVALSSLRDVKTVGALGKVLGEPFDALRGRALDALLEISGSQATQMILQFFETHAQELELCDKIIRALKVPKELTKKALDTIDAVQKSHPKHPLLEDLLLMRDRLALVHRGQTKPETTAVGGVDSHIHGLDRELSGRIRGYTHLDEPVKAALRAAEIPFLQRDFFAGDVDKSAVILQYCKALDMAMEAHFGKKVLFPRLHQALHLFQNTLFKGGLVEDYPQPLRVLKFFELETVYTVESLPLGKMVSIAKSIMNGKILHEHWKVVDGLKAWGVMVLLFTRESTATPGALGLKPVVRLGTSGTTSLGARLVALQDIRNPVAHRLTLTQYPRLEQLRGEVEKTFAEFAQAFGLGNSPGSPKI